MANRRFTQFNYSLHAMPVHIDGNVAIGATGAVGTIVGPGVAGITRLTTGIYQFQLNDNYYKLFGADFNFQAPVTGGAVNAGSFSAGTVYQIVTLGTTTQAQWVTAGVPTGITAAPGVVFKAAGIGAGNGTVKALGASGITNVELLGSTNLMVGPSVQGALITIKCLGPTSSGDTTPVATDPASGSYLYFDFYLSNSSVIFQGE